MKQKNKLLLLLVLLMTAATGAWAQSTPTEVSTFADLQTALSAGNNVKLTANIQFTSSITISGSKKILIDGNGKTMSGPSTCAFIISSGNTLAIKNATIDNFDRSAGGGAIRNGGTLVLDGCTVSNNHTDGSNQGGGAIENQGTLYASNTTFSGNYSSEIGGAINNYGGSLYLTGCTFSNNYTTSSNANYGGAIGVNGGNEIRIINCTFSGNKYNTSSGASDLGIYSNPSNYTIAGCTGITVKSSSTLSTFKYGAATLNYSDLNNILFTYESSDEPIPEKRKVSLKEGTEDADKWTITPAEATTTGVAKGETVTVTYTGTKKVLGVKAEKKAATKVLYSWESPEGTPTETGGTIAYVNGDTSGGDRVNYLHTETGIYTICLNGKLTNITDGTGSQNSGRMDVTLDEALAAGDVITITAYIYKSDTGASSDAYVIFNGANGFDSSDMSIYAESEAFDSNNNLYFSGAAKTVTVKVPAEAAGRKSFSMTRGITKTNLFITKLTISRGN